MITLLYFIIADSLALSVVQVFRALNELDCLKMCHGGNSASRMTTFQRNDGMTG